MSVMATSNEKLMLQAAETIMALRAEVEELREELTKARRPSQGATVADAIGSVIEADLAKRRTTQVRKSAEGVTHPHFVNEARAVRKEKLDAELERIASEGAKTTLDALRAKAGL